MTAASSVPPNSDHPLNVIVATDCGSTTTKAILIEKVGDEYRQTYRGEAPTTVEAPFEDVTRGVLNAIAEIEELSGRKILDGDQIITPCRDARTGVDIYISTSSAGGGLQMMVAGVVQNMTGESAQRAALGAGAIVMDVLASNDGRLPHEKIERIRSLRPDMILMSGGTDGGAVTHVVEMAEYIAAAEPRPRFGITYKLPLIYAGNKDAQSQVKRILGEKTALEVTDNIRPVLERENLAPARNKIHDLFLEHVMQQAPRLQEADRHGGRPHHADSRRGRAHHGDHREARTPQLDRRGHRGRDDGRVLGLRRGLQPDRQRESRHDLQYFQRPGRGRTGEHHALGAVYDRRADAAKPHQEQDDPADDDSADARRVADRARDCPRGLAVGARCITSRWPPA